MLAKTALIFLSSFLVLGLSTPVLAQDQKVPELKSEDALTQAQTVVRQYQEKMQAFDPQIANLYDDKAILKVQIYAPTGDFTLNLNLMQAKEYMKATMQSYQDSGSALMMEFPMVSYTPDNGAIWASFYYRFYATGGAAATGPYLESRMKIGKNGKGQWRILEEQAVLKDSQGATAAILKDFAQSAGKKTTIAAKLTLPVSQTIPPSSTVSGSSAQHSDTHHQKTHSPNQSATVPRTQLDRSGHDIMMDEQHKKWAEEAKNAKSMP